MVGSLRDREVACSASDLKGSNFKSCIWRAVSVAVEVFLAQFSLNPIHFICFRFDDAFHLQQDALLNVLQLFDCIPSICQSEDVYFTLHCAHLLCMGQQNQLANDNESVITTKIKKHVHPHHNLLSYLDRNKRWQYSDLLQVCINANCEGQRGPNYYQCVVNQCVV